MKMKESQIQKDRPMETLEPTSPPETETSPTEADDSRPAGPVKGDTEPEPERSISARRVALYAGLFVLALQLLYVYSFFPTYDEAVATREGSETVVARAYGERAERSAAGHARPDFLQWSGAHSLVWLASLFVTNTPVRHLPAIFFFLIMGGFFASMYHPPHHGRVLSTVLVSARNGMLLWVSWLAGAVILFVYLLTSGGEAEALPTTAAITFEDRWEGIARVFMAHGLVYVAWFAFLAVLPMFGGVVLGLIRTRLLTERVADAEPA